MVGLFPGLRADAAFADIGATVESALAPSAVDGSQQPVRLVKEMPGLEAKFALTPASFPLVEVVGLAAADGPQVTHSEPYGSLKLVGMDWDATADDVNLALHWQVDAPLSADYTTTIQLFDAQGDKIGQDDRPPGGIYYPTTLWKPGETLVDRHTVKLSPNSVATTVLVAMYAGPELEMLAPPLILNAPK
ncbi:MAG: hypothetical protein HC802_18420 [Caldilineaceae bacterium]|nr:hypothetical protein [Caldilineaceae bacterium]